MRTSIIHHLPVGGPLAVRCSILIPWLLALCATSTIAQDIRYVRTAGYYSETTDLEAAVQQEFGPDARVADWATIKANFTGRIAQWCDDAGLHDYRDQAWCKRNGADFWSSGRHYFLERHEGNVPGGWLVHDDIDQNFLDLGSWYGNKRIMAAVPIQPSLGFLSVDDTDPRNPTLTFEVEGSLTGVEWSLDGASQPLGDFGPGAHQFVLENLHTYGSARHDLVLRGHGASGPVEDRCTVDTRWMGWQEASKTWAIYVTVENLGARSVTARVRAGVYRWEWSLPGARYDRHLDGASLTLTSTLPIRGFRHEASTAISTPDSQAYGETVSGIGNGVFWSQSYVAKLGGFGKAASTEITAVVRGFSTGPSPSGSALWLFLPPSPPTMGVLEFMLR